MKLFSRKKGMYLPDNCGIVLISLKGKLGAFKGEIDLQTDNIN